MGCRHGVAQSQPQLKRLSSSSSSSSLVIDSKLFTTIALTHMIQKGQKIAHK